MNFLRIRQLEALWRRTQARIVAADADQRRWAEQRLLTVVQLLREFENNLRGLRVEVAELREWASSGGGGDVQVLEGTMAGSAEGGGYPGDGGREVGISGDQDERWGDGASPLDAQAGGYGGVDGEPQVEDDGPEGSYSIEVHAAAALAPRANALTALMAEMRGEDDGDDGESGRISGESNGVTDGEIGGEIDAQADQEQAFDGREGGDGGYDDGGEEQGGDDGGGYEGDGGADEGGPEEEGGPDSEPQALHSGGGGGDSGSGEMAPSHSQQRLHSSASQRSTSGSSGAAPAGSLSAASLHGKAAQHGGSRAADDGEPEGDSEETDETAADST
ncbi:hypothetical protein JKP88DRAFT_353465 [Tribonema minus]|uniref:Uncharacterized protein n=1 Tax=Tribonema minus TaxID=303371 RepID=A0A835Z891_9STRA|nr:hypothetical protein JKP88DRAFT_353465 [Tribonema minus]